MVDPRLDRWITQDGVLHARDVASDFLAANDIPPKQKLAIAMLMISALSSGRLAEAAEKMVLGFTREHLRGEEYARACADYFDRALEPEAIERECASPFAGLVPLDFGGHGPR